MSRVVPAVFEGKFPPLYKSSPQNGAGRPLQLQFFTEADRSKYCSTRAGETRIGEKVQLIQTNDSAQLHTELLRLSMEKNVHYAILGVPEDIGPRANCGRGGSDGAWNAFLKFFLTMQSNDSLIGDNVVVIGNVKTDDLMSRASSLDISKEDDLKSLRHLVAELDDRVMPVVRAIISARLELILVGGGHNNSYPLIRGSAEALGRAVSVVNNDPHADTRPVEDGRHSGNGFSLSVAEGYLDNYAVLGYHKRYNSKYITSFMQALTKQHRGLFYSYEEILDEDHSLREAALSISSRFGLKPMGIEMCLDAIPFMPSSAATPSGLSLEDCRRFVRLFAKKCNPVYLDLAEGAPSLGGADGDRTVGKATAYLAADYIETRDTARKSSRSSFGFEFFSTMDF